MRFDNVSILGLAQVIPPHRIASSDIDAALAETYARLGLPSRLLESLTGVRARRFWDVGARPSDGATQVGRNLIDATGIDASRIGVLINTSVCHDFVEPSVACVVHANLGLAETCLNFDVSNACLGFLDGMAVVGNMIERGQIEYGLIVDAEDSRYVVEQTLQRLRGPACDQVMLREQLPTLTVGSGAAAMLLGPSRLASGGPRFLGGVSLAATRHNHLCRGTLDTGITDTRNLLAAGLELANRTWIRAQQVFGWTAESVDLFALHQVSELHTQELARTLGFPLAKAALVYPELGNVGPASVPMALAQARDAERLSSGDQVILGGIGSGLNCTAAALVW